MSRILKVLGLCFVVAIVIWLITLWRWQNQAHDVTMSDIALQLVLLPILITAALYLVVLKIAKWRSPASSTLSLPDSSSIGSIGLDDEAVRLKQAYAWLVAEAVNLPIGADSEAAWVALNSGGRLVDLDPHLTDLDGMPIFSARVAELDIESWQMMQPTALQEVAGSLSPSVLRSLNLLEEPLQRVLDVLTQLHPHVGPDLGKEREGFHDWHEHSAMSAQGKAHLAGVARPLSAAERVQQAASRPALTVQVYWPSHWSTDERSQAQDWLQTKCDALDAWCDAVRALPVTWQFEVLQDEEEVWSSIDCQILQWARDARPALTLLLAVDSAIDPDCVLRWQEQGSLFTGHHQRGLIPSEGAAALLLAHPDWPHLLRSAPHAVRMMRPLLAERQKSADAPGPTGSAILASLIEEAVGLQPVAAPEEVLVVSDADHRASRTAELYEAVQSSAPQLDLTSQVLRLGDACGDLGIARVVATTAVASAALRASEGRGVISLAAHVHASRQRVVVPLLPALRAHSLSSVASV